jgi:hypothetical protein
VANKSVIIWLYETLSLPFGVTIWLDDNIDAIICLDNITNVMDDSTALKICCCLLSG